MQLALVATRMRKCKTDTPDVPRLRDANRSSSLSTTVTCRFHPLTSLLRFRLIGSWAARDRPSTANDFKVTLETHFVSYQSAILLNISWLVLPPTRDVLRRPVLCLPFRHPSFAHGMLDRCARVCLLKCLYQIFSSVVSCRDNIRPQSKT